MNVLKVRRGNTRELIFRFPVGFDLTGSEFVFFARWQGGSLRKEDLTMDVEARTVTVPLTLADIRAFPLGRLAEFELERRIGTNQETPLAGMIETVEGVNDDV